MVDIEDFAMEEIVKLLKNFQQRMFVFDDSSTDLIYYLIYYANLKDHFYDYLKKNKRQLPAILLSSVSKDEDYGNPFEQKDTKTDANKAKEKELISLRDHYANAVTLQLDEENSQLKSINNMHIFACQQQFVRLNTVDDMTQKIKEEMQNLNPNYKCLDAKHENAINSFMNDIDAIEKKITRKQKKIFDATKAWQKANLEKNVGVSELEIEKEQLRQEIIEMKKDRKKIEDEFIWSPLSAIDIQLASKDLTIVNIYQIKKRYLVIKKNIVKFASLDLGN